MVESEILVSKSQNKLDIKLGITETSEDPFNSMDLAMLEENLNVRDQTPRMQGNLQHILGKLRELVSNR